MNFPILLLPGENMVSEPSYKVEETGQHIEFRGCGTQELYSAEEWRPGEQQRHQIELHVESSARLARSVPPNAPPALYSAGRECRHERTSLALLGGR